MRCVRISHEKTYRFILDLWRYAKARLAHVTPCISAHLVKVDGGKGEAIPGVIGWPNPQI